MRKNSTPGNIKGQDKSISPRLTLRFQSLKSKDEPLETASKEDAPLAHSKYPSYCVMMGKEAQTKESSQKGSDSQSCQSDNSDIVSSTTTKLECEVFLPQKETRKLTKESLSCFDLPPRASETRSSSISSTNSLSYFDFPPDSEKVDVPQHHNKRQKSSDSTSSSKSTTSTRLRAHRSHSAKSDLHPETRSSTKKTVPETEMESGEVEPEKTLTHRELSSHNGINNNCSPLSSCPNSPRVPPLKIVLPCGNNSLDSAEERKERKVSSSRQNLPYVVSSTEDFDDAIISSTTPSLANPNKSSEESSNNKIQSPSKPESTKSDATKNESSKEAPPSPEERCQRITRSSLKLIAALNNNKTASSSKGPLSTSSSNHKASEQTEPPAVGGDDLTLHPRKRKIKPKEEGNLGNFTLSQFSSSNSNSSEDSQTPQLNNYQMFQQIRKQVDQRRKSMCIIQPKAPQNFKDYLLNRCSYHLEGKDHAIPSSSPPNCLDIQMKDLFGDQQKDRNLLGLHHQIEREKLILSVEQEILRVHGRAARAMANQGVPLSVCSVLKDEEIYNIIENEQEEKDKNAHRSRFNGRQFFSWLQDVYDKWEKIKELMLLRHHNEAESLHASQKLDWEWKLKEFNLCEVKCSPIIDSQHVPMVIVNDEFDLIPS